MAVVRGERQASVKGNAVLGVVRFVERTYGADGLARLTAELPDSDQAVLRGILLPGGWYPIGLWNRLGDRQVQIFGSGNADSFRPVAEFIASSDLSSIYKVLLKVATPEMILWRTPSLWERYFNVGRAEPQEEEPNKFVVHITGSVREDEGPGPVTCAAGVPAWLARAVSLAGAKGSYARERACRFRGARTCEIEVGWHGE
jgi:hypothetical protein